MTVALTSRRSGSGEPFVLLHPGGTDSRSLELLAAELSGYALLMPDQRGHGRTADAPGPLTFADMAADTAAFIESESAEPVHLFGHSDGAIVALHLALARPDLVKSLVFASGVWHHDGWLPGVLDGEAPDFMRDSYGEVSPDGIEHWAVMVQKLDAMHETQPALTTHELGALAVPTLILAGDDDEIRFEHLIALYDALPNGELAIIPRASHGVVVEKPELIARLIRDFHDPKKGDGFAPIRRGGSV
ncbi:alpha/beta fold hydrolase [Microbacteriaceae bacterium VKM Ac-2854]|nr:alpha/beta fold hydrolase [Microbacteriaceae bacterium VKM Ac-2854]